MELWTAIWQSIILGTVQGLTEFLPVSSSGHLLFFRTVLGVDFAAGGMFYDLMMHFGTLVAVFIVLRKQIFALFKKPFTMLFMLVVATIPAGLVGFLCEDKIDEIFNGDGGILYLGLCFAFTAIMLLTCEYISKRRKTDAPLGWKHSTTMGLMQAVALFPGISRSGSTIVAGVVSGAKREEAASFSFIMSIPIILGGVFLNCIDIAQEPALITAIGVEWIVGTCVGVVFAAVSGYFAIKFMLKLVAKANYKWFSFYLAIMSIVSISLSCANIL